MNREQMKHSGCLAAFTTRYHAWPTLNTQTIGHHQCRVAQLVVELFGMPRAEVLYYALYHDMGEYFSGDLPFMVKTAIPGLADAMKLAEAYGLKQLGVQMPELSPLEKSQVKIADLIEMHEFGHMEVLMGNHFGAAVRDDTLAEAQRVASQYGLTNEVDAWLRKDRL